MRISEHGYQVSLCLWFPNQWGRGYVLASFAVILFFASMGIEVGISALIERMANAPYS
jgi:hypothetical protein